MHPKQTGGLGVWLQYTKTRGLTKAQINFQYIAITLIHGLTKKSQNFVVVMRVHCSFFIITYKQRKKKKNI